MRFALGGPLRTSAYRQFFISIVIVFNSATVSLGGSIEIANSGFEEPGLAELELAALPNLDGTVPPPGAWYSAIELHTKIMHVNSSLFATGAAEGVNALRLQARAGAHAQQNVGPILLNHRYTLTAEVGRSLTETFGPSPNLPYYYAMSALFALPLPSYTLEIARLEDPVSPMPGAWAAVAFTFDTPDADTLDKLAPGWRELGEADLLIDFHAIRNAVSGGNAAVYFDDVSLSAVPLPEPSTLALCACALLTIPLLWRHLRGQAVG